MQGLCNGNIGVNIKSVHKKEVSTEIYYLNRTKSFALKQVFLLLACCISLAAVAQKPIRLFNGKDLSGWTIHGTEKWYVEKGELICESGPDKQYGYLSTDSAYQDFEFSCQFKQEANGNSGVFFRSSIEGVKISGWQVEVAPINMHTGGIYESYGRGWLVQPSKEDEQWLKQGEWNTLKIVAKGPHITTWLNGHKMVDWNDEKIGAGKGFIALQIHDGGGIKVRWKDLKLKKI